jgi:hypothetical protein
VTAISTLLLKEVASRASERGVTLALAPSLVARLVEEGYAPQYGARGRCGASTRARARDNPLAPRAPLPRERRAFTFRPPPFKNKTRTPF